MTYDKLLGMLLNRKIIDVKTTSLGVVTLTLEEVDNLYSTLVLHQSCSNSMTILGDPNDLIGETIINVKHNIQSKWGAFILSPGRGYNSKTISITLEYADGGVSFCYYTKSSQLDECAPEVCAEISCVYKEI